MLVYQRVRMATIVNKQSYGDASNSSNHRRVMTWKSHRFLLKSWLRIIDSWSGSPPRFSRLCWRALCDLCYHMVCVFHISTVISGVYHGKPPQVACYSLTYLPINQVVESKCFTIHGGFQSMGVPQIIQSSWMTILVLKLMALGLGDPPF